MALEIRHDSLRERALTRTNGPTYALLYLHRQSSSYAACERQTLRAKSPEKAQQMTSLTAPLRMTAMERLWSIVNPTQRLESTRLTPELLRILRGPSLLHVLPLQFKKDMWNTPILPKHGPDLIWRSYLSHLAHAIPYSQ
jgi:hypothetical protein